MLFFVAKCKKIPTVLLNARISDRSWKSYKKFSFIYKQIFKNVDLVFAQSQKDKIRLEALGAKNIEIVGNIKLCSPVKIDFIFKKPKNFVTLAASTHKGEEELIIRSWLKNKQGMLVVVPRHPERFGEVESFMKKIAKQNGFSFQKFSENSDLVSELVLVDKMGILNEFFAICDLVILGGAFKPIGGHNFVEPAFFKKPLITGRYYFNQEAIFPFIKNIYVANDEQDLTELLKKKEDLLPSKILQKPDLSKISQKILDILN